MRVPRISVPLQPVSHKVSDSTSVQELNENISRSLVKLKINAGFQEDRKVIQTARNRLLQRVPIIMAQYPMPIAAKGTDTRRTSIAEPVVVLNNVRKSNVL